MAEAKLCAVEGCGKKLFSRGVCNWHYKRLPDRPVCSEMGCGRPEHGRGLCSMHHHRLLRNGSKDVRLRSANLELEQWIEAHVTHDSDECLIWPYWRDKHGYGQTRKMCEAANGPPPMAEMQAAHICGKGHEGCIHPKHLKWATRAETQSAMVTRGNSLRGRKNPNARLSEDDVRKIRRLAKDITRQEIADLFGIARSTVSRVIQRKTWGWLT